VPTASGSASHRPPEMDRSCSLIGTAMRELRRCSDYRRFLEPPAQRAGTRLGRPASYSRVIVLNAGEAACWAQEGDCAGARMSLTALQRPLFARKYSGTPAASSNPTRRAAATALDRQRRRASGLARPTTERRRRVTADLSSRRSCRRVTPRPRPELPALITRLGDSGLWAFADGGL
jgi:hypothetical protein